MAENEETTTAVADEQAEQQDFTYSVKVEDAGPGTKKVSVEIPQERIQSKLADMLLAVNNGTLLAFHLGRMKDDGRLLSEHVSFGKLNNVNAALAVAREARTVLGANGITLEYPVIRHMNNLESVLTYEGTAEVHRLVLGHAITGLAAFR